LQSLLERFKQQKPDLAATVEIQVVPLQAVIQKLKTGNDANLNQIVLVPPQESVEDRSSLPPPKINLSQRHRQVLCIEA
jgi:nickel transport protein